VPEACKSLGYTMRTWAKCPHRNLISASRVIFCEPVWHPDVESQAIKVRRLHHSVCTRGLNYCLACTSHGTNETSYRSVLSAFKCLLYSFLPVRTLVIRSTAEEAMISRRQYLRSNDKIPNMMTESGMREFIEVWKSSALALALNLTERSSTLGS
jgi:hypothetical protein